MKVKIGKSMKVDGEFHYYEVESDEIPFDNLQKTKELLEKFVQGWINDYKPKQNGNGNGNGKPEAHSGYCVHCGKKIDPKYIQCFDCFKKHQDKI